MRGIGEAGVPVDQRVTASAMGFRAKNNFSQVTVMPRKR
jgi:hypothetical protein